MDKTTRGVEADVGFERGRVVLERGATREGLVKKRAFRFNKLSHVREHM